MVRTLIIVALLASTANADVSALVGIGVSRIDDSNGDVPLLPALDVFVGAHLDAHWSLGGRLQLSWPVHTSGVFSVGGGGQFDVGDYTLQPLDVGLAVQYQSDHWWLAPWIGEHVTFGSLHEYGSSLGEPFDYPVSSFVNEDFLELGLTAGFDVIEQGTSRLSIYADYHRGFGRTTDSSSDEWTDRTVANWGAATLGLAYRR